MERIFCRQCGFKIVFVEWGRNAHAQHRGFCSAGCEEAYDDIHEMEYRWAREQEAA